MSEVYTPKTTFVPGVAHPFPQDLAQKTLRQRVLALLESSPEGLTVEDVCVSLCSHKSRVTPFLLDFVDSKEVICTITKEAPIYRFKHKLLPPKFDVATLIGKVAQYIADHPGVSMAQIVEAHPGVAAKFTVANLKQQGRCKVVGGRGHYQYYIT